MMHFHAHMRFQRLLVIIIVIVIDVISCAHANIEYSHNITPENKSRYIFSNGTILYCLPILKPHFCDEGREIKPCLQDGEPDRCELCMKGYANLDRTTSDFQTPCYMFSCPENSVQVEKRPDDGCNQPCECDYNAGFVKDFACMCQQVDFTCQPNTFLNVKVRTDKCIACPVGSHKPGFGYGPCVPLPSTQNNPTLNQTSPQPSKNVTENPTDDVDDVEKTTQGDTVGGKNTNEPRTKSSFEPYQFIIIITASAAVGILLVVIPCVVCKLQGQKAKVPQYQPQNQPQPQPQPQQDDRASHVTINITSQNVQVGQNNVISHGMTQSQDDDAENQSLTNAEGDDQTPVERKSLMGNHLMWDPPTMDSEKGSFLTQEASSYSSADPEQVQPKTLQRTDTLVTEEEDEDGEVTGSEGTGTPDSKTSLLKHNGRPVQ